MIARYGGSPIVAPALREVPLESNGAALDFAAELLLGGIDIAIFLTGAGVRALFEVLAVAHPGDDVRAALSRVKIAARGPKPSNVLRELNVPVWVTAPEPNTWRELLSAMDARAADQPIAGARIAVHEYGVPNQELLDALEARGAIVMRVPVYKWALPRRPRTVAARRRRHCGRRDPRSAPDLRHPARPPVAGGRDDGLRNRVSQRAGVNLHRIDRSDHLRGARRRGLAPDLEASHPKLGFLVKEAAEHTAGVLAGMRRRPTPLESTAPIHA